MVTLIQLPTLPPSSSPPSLLPYTPPLPPLLRCKQYHVIPWSYTIFRHYAREMVTERPRFHSHSCHSEPIAIGWVQVLDYSRWGLMQDLPQEGERSIGGIRLVHHNLVMIDDSVPVLEVGWTPCKLYG